MLSFKDFLHEIFNKSYPFERTLSTDKDVSYGFTTSTNKKVTVDFMLEEFEFRFISSSPVQGWELFFDVDNVMRLTGGGDAFAIFSTVIKITKDFIEKNDPDVLVFSANKSEQSRVDFYTSMTKKFISQTGYAYKMPTKKSSDFQKFVLYKPKSKSKSK